MLNNKIKKYLEKLDREVSIPNIFYAEFKIAEEIKNILRKEDKNYIPSNEDIAEQIAFDFLADYPNNNSSWGTYYGPMFILPNKQGQMMEYPSIQKITEETLNYWQIRAKKSKNPILSSRYADLVIDFSPSILQESADYKLFHLVIDASIIICEKLLAQPINCKKKAKRALNLSLKISDQQRIQKIGKTIIKLERKITIDSKPGLWGFAFKWLLLDFRNKVVVSPQEKEDLIKVLEKKLERIKKDPWSAEHAVSLLAEYYANERDESNLMRVLGILEKSFKENERMNSDALLKVHAFEQIHEIYQKYRDKDFQEITKATNRISQEIGQLDLDWNKSLKEISVSTKIKNEEIDKFLKAIFGEENEYKLENILSRIVINFLPKQKNIEDQLKEISKNHPLQFLCTTQIISEDGIPIAKLSSLDDDYDNHFQNYATKYLQFNSIFLSLTMDELKKQISKEEIVKYFQESLLFQNENKEYVKYAFNAYRDSKYIVSSHLFIPLIESAVRELVRICGGIILKPNDIGGYDRLSLNILLKRQSDLLKIVFSKIGHNIPFYFRLVLTEKLGMNLRNNFAHGLEKKTFFSREASDRLFHILLCLSLVKEKKEKS
ncbi:hypothetical protein CVT91_01365 [Candidatus Atribacteria bacterium HGW-Atribacteria-1]|nr:MAG: hypothetical protein CVT91_01365 [Candidatus Atribacteria bacterium HGW-Atribacteria-1]